MEVSKEHKCALHVSVDPANVVYSNNGYNFNYMAYKDLRINSPAYYSLKDACIAIETVNSLLDSEIIDYCKNVLDNYKDKIILPVDAVVAKDINDNNYKVVDINNISDTDMGLDIGPETVKLFSKYIEMSKTIIWNGPMGVFENPLYQNGTKGICEAFNKDQIVIVGGGDSASAVVNLGYKDKVTHISTGGGASLELLEGKELPGIEAIKVGE